MLRYSRMFMFCFYTIIAMAPRTAMAIQFVDMTIDDAWQCTTLETSYCKCHKGDELSPTDVWVGLCQNDLPHGKGYLIERQYALLRLANKGRIINTQGAVDSSGLESITQHKVFWHDYVAVINAPHEREKGPNQTALSQKIKHFLSSHGNAPDRFKQKVRELEIEDRQRQINSGYQASLKSNSTQYVERYLDWWQPQLSQEQIATLNNRIDLLVRQSEEKNARAERLSQAEQQRREHMRLHACELFYPGYVGKYQTRGLLGSSTSDYVVRYVNSQQSRVTIEGRGGLALKFGEMLELSCFDLWERSQ